MRKLLIVLFVLAIVVSSHAIDPQIAYNVEGRISAYQQLPYTLVNTATSADTALAANTKYWDSINPSSTSGTWLRIDPRWTLLEYAFYCYGDGDGAGDPNGGEFDFKIHLARRYSSSKVAYEGYAACGELELSCYPCADRISAGYSAGEQINSGSLDANQSYKWVDSIDPNGGSDEDWMSDVVVTTGTDDLGTVTLRANGAFLTWVEITNFPADVTSITAVVTGYSKE